MDNISPARLDGAEHCAPSPLPPHDDPTDTLGDPLTYSPEAYRWVPVKRVPRFDGWTEEKQRRFIEVLADTGQVRLAAAAVQLSRQSAYKLRRAPGGEAFARAWDAARLHAAPIFEDAAFELAIEGTEVPLFNSLGELIGSRVRHEPRLLMFLLRHLKPDVYGRDAPATPRSAPPPMEAVLRALEPALPAPPETLVEAGELPHALELAEIAGGRLPHFLDEMRAPPSDPEDDLLPEARAAFEAALAEAKREAAGSTRPSAFDDRADRAARSAGARR